MVAPQIPAHQPELLYSADMPMDALLVDALGAEPMPDAAVRAAAAVLVGNAMMQQAAAAQIPAAGADVNLPQPMKEQAAAEQPRDAVVGGKDDILRQAAAPQTLRAAARKPSLYREVAAALQHSGITAMQLLQAKQAGDAAAVHVAEAPAPATTLVVMDGRVQKKKGRPRKATVSASSFATSVQCMASSAAQLTGSVYYMATDQHEDHAKEHEGISGQRGQLPRKADQVRSQNHAAAQWPPSQRVAKISCVDLVGCLCCNLH